MCAYSLHDAYHIITGVLLSPSTA